MIALHAKPCQDNLHPWTIGSSDESALIAFVCNVPPPTSFPRRGLLLRTPCQGVRRNTSAPDDYKLELFVVSKAYLVEQACFSWDKMGLEGGGLDAAAAIDARQDSNTSCSLESLASVRLNNVGLGVRPLPYFLRFLRSSQDMWTPNTGSRIALRANHVTRVVFKLEGIDFPGLSIFCYRISSDY